MAAGWRKRWRVVALGLALAVTAGVAGVSVAVAWRRAHSPRRTLHLEPKAEDLRFLGDAHTLAVGTFSEERGWSWEAFSLETSRVIGTFHAPLAWANRSSHAVFRVGASDTLHVERRDLVTQERIGHEFVLGEPSALDAELSNSETTIALLTHDMDLELRSSLTGALLNAIAARARPDDASSSESEHRWSWSHVDSEKSWSLALSPRGDQVAVRRVTRLGAHTTTVYSWATGQQVGQWSRDVFLGFTSTDDLVFRVRDDQGECDHLRVVGPDNALRFEVPAYRTAAISGSGTRIAITAPVARELEAFAVVVLALDTGAVLRSFPQTGPSSVQLALSPDGDAVAIASQDGTVEIWDVPP